MIPNTIHKIKYTENKRVRKRIAYKQLAVISKVDFHLTSNYFNE